MFVKRYFAIGVLLALSLALGGCAVVVDRDGPGRPVATRDIKDAVPKKEPKSKYGNPDSYVVLRQKIFTPWIPVPDFVKAVLLRGMEKNSTGVGHQAARHMICIR